MAIAVGLLALYMATLSNAQGSGSFIAVGDWGGIGLPPYRTPREVHVSNQMAATAEEINASYVVALGDNFYFAGIRSDVHDARFQSTFEDVFHQKSLDIPWLVCAGNHDHYGNVTAQVAYSQVSRRWKFPNLYWTHTFSFGKYTVQWVMIDTPTLVKDLRGMPSDFDGTETPSLDSLYAAEPDWSQLEWLESTLALSKADFLFVAGHYPVYSVAEHGTDMRLVHHLKPLIDRYNVTAYFNGHDHNLQHIRPKESAAHYVVSGAGNLADTSLAHKGTVPHDSLLFHWPDVHPGTTGGFVSGKLVKGRYDISFVDSTGKILHETSLLPRVSASISEVLMLK